MKTLLILAALAAQDNVKAEYESKLKNLRITLDFQNAPLDSIVDYLREITAMNIFVDVKVREKNLQLSVKVKDISLQSIFNLTLKPHGCGVMFKDGVLMIMTQEDVADRTMKMELYDCRDILHPIQDFPGVDIQLNVEGGVTIPTGDDGGGGGEMPIEEMVRAHTGGRSWEENPKASVKLQNGLLVVRNTPDVHRQVRRLLDLLRANK